MSNNNKEKVKLSTEAEIDVVIVEDDTSDYYDYCDKNSVHYETLENVDNDDTQKLESQPKQEMQTEVSGKST